MKSVDQPHSDALCQALLALPPSGPNGFEGLLGIVLGSITGQSFRLAKSGSQRGRDGDSAFDGGATYFEGKRYQESPRPPEITAKLFDLVKDDAGQVDLWVIGATCEIAAQTTADMRGVCDRLGIGSVLLDWNDNDLGPLLIAIANADKRTKDFLNDNLRQTAGASLINDALIAIDHFAQHPDLPARLQTLRDALSAEEAGLGHARRHNRDWLTEKFSSRVAARALLGQPLAPLDSLGLTKVPRPLEAKLARAFAGVPEAEIYAVLGEEGVGKSWLTASAWLDHDSPSILILIPADKLSEPMARNDFESFLIRGLIEQTGGQHSERTKERWRRRIKGWRANPSPANVRITMVFDGLNQPLQTDWSKILDYAAMELAKLGGCLVITTRSTHWKNIKDCLFSSILEVPVIPWTDTEVMSILTSRGVDGDKVKQDVLQSLRNPRILGIAVDLLSNKDVETLGQLSVGRLLFEHLRKAQIAGVTPLSGQAFADLMKKLAKETLSRAARQQADDLRLFDPENHHRLQDVASCCFFEPVKGSLQYEIKQDGLNLGLALYVIESLEKELRNKRDPREHLAIILEPIAALDETAKIVFLATQIACLDEDASPEVRSALIEHFISLQNLPHTELEAFAILVRTAAPSFLTATENIHTRNSHASNAAWLLYALHNQRDDTTVWAAISETIRRWLAFYSLAPERRMFKVQGKDADTEVREEREKYQEIIEKTVVTLTEIEREYIRKTLVQANFCRFDTLHQWAFYLLAGKSLEGFADDLVKWSFSESLGPATHAPHKEFKQLIRFNRVDWEETRVALLKIISTFEGNNSSEVGKWATVKILNATGSIDDAAQASNLSEWLTRDQKKQQGWFLLDEYCAVDPCDPATEKPDNVAATAKQYRAIHPSKLAPGRGLGSEGQFFDQARAGVVRFHLNDAVVPHRELADDISNRTGEAKKQAIHTLRVHSAALTRQQADTMLKLGQACAVGFNKDTRHEWLTAQFCIFAGLPHIPADNQLEEISNIKGGNVLHDICEMLLPASEEAVERALQQVMQSEDDTKQISILLAIHYSVPPLSAKSRLIIADLLNSPAPSVRAHAMGVVAACRDHDLLKKVVASGWGALPLQSNEKTPERWYGSFAILEAAKAGLVDLDDALDRMALHHYGFAAQALGGSAAKEIAKRVEVALANAIGYTHSTNLPQMSTSTPDAASPAFPFISLSDPPASQDIQGQLDRLSETNEQFYARQERMQRSFDDFTREVTKAHAQLILADLKLGGMQALIEADEKAGKRWIELLNAASDTSFCCLHHVAIQLAVTLANEPGAEKLLVRAVNTRPLINRVAGTGKIPEESLILWHNADKPAVLKICKERLVTCQDDSNISIEVLSALICKHAKIVEDTIDDLQATGRPIDTCLALTLAGFCDESAHASSTLARFEGVQGYIGIAHRAAAKAYQRNLWARHWHEQMRSAQTPLMFWQASVLLTKVVDVRFDIWGANTGAESDIFRAFLPTVKHEITNRIRKYQSKRKDNLFGDKCPASFFLSDGVPRSELF